MEITNGGNMIIQLGLGLIIILLFILIKRVSALKKIIEEISIKLNSLEPVAVPEGPARAAPAPAMKPAPVAAGSAEVPNAVIAAISAAVNQYRVENN